MVNYKDLSGKHLDYILFRILGYRAQRAVDQFGISQRLVSWLVWRGNAFWDDLLADFDFWAARDHRTGVTFYCSIVVGHVVDTTHPTINNLARATMGVRQITSKMSGTSRFRTKFVKELYHGRHPGARALNPNLA